VNDKIFWLVLVVVVGGAVGVFMLSGGKTPDAAMIGQMYEDVGNRHLPPDQVGQYNTVPATSGDHGERVEYGEYSQGLSDYDALHGLEHGAVAFWYNAGTITEDELSQVRTTFESLNVGKKYLAPRSNLENNVKLAMTAWTYLLTQEEIDTEEMITFFNGHVNQGPELALNLRRLDT